jgi:hypothetical protein
MKESTVTVERERAKSTSEKKERRKKVCDTIHVHPSHANWTGATSGHTTFDGWAVNHIITGTRDSVAPITYVPAFLVVSVYMTSSLHKLCHKKGQNKKGTK